MKRVEMLLYGVLLDGSRKSWKTFAFEMKFRDGGYIKYSQTGSVRRGKGKPKKPNTSLQPDLTPAGTGVTEPSPLLPPGPLPTSGLPPTSLQPTVGPTGRTPRPLTPTQSTEVLITKTLGLAEKYLDILDTRGEKRIMTPSPTPSCDLDLDLDFDPKAGVSANSKPRHIQKKRVFNPSQPTTRSALPVELLNADSALHASNASSDKAGLDSVSQVDGADSGSASDDGQRSPYEWNVVKPRREKKLIDLAREKRPRGVRWAI